MWPDKRLTTLLGTRWPIVQAPMAGANGAAMVIAVCEAGGLGSLPCAVLSPDAIRAEFNAIRAATSKPLNANFFCHVPTDADPDQQRRWSEKFQLFYKEFGVSASSAAGGFGRTPFDSATCDLVEELRPEVVSFHFGLPDALLLTRVKKAGCVVLSSATTVAEARWLEANGADVIIAQGAEAGGHRGMFLTERTSSQPGTLALVPQVVDAVRVPVIAAGGIADGRGIAAAIALGASGVQIGTAYLFTPEALISEPHRRALSAAQADDTALTNVFTGRPARSLFNRVMRELGPMNDAAPAFPHAAGALAPLRQSTEAVQSGDFAPLWSGQAAALAVSAGAGELTLKLADQAVERLRFLGEVG